MRLNLTRILLFLHRLLAYHHWQDTPGGWSPSGTHQHCWCGATRYHHNPDWDGQEW